MTDADKRLSPDGYKLRAAIAGAGFEITPGELADGLDAAHERCGGPWDACRVCGDTEEDLRWGVCWPCAQKGGKP